MPQLLYFLCGNVVLAVLCISCNCTYRTCTKDYITLHSLLNNKALGTYWSDVAMEPIHIKPDTFEPQSDEESDATEEPGACILD